MIYDVGCTSRILCSQWEHKYRKRSILCFCASYYTIFCVIGQAVFLIFCVFSVFRRCAQNAFGILWILSNLSFCNPIAVRNILYHKNGILSRQTQPFSESLSKPQETQDTRTRNRINARYRIYAVTVDIKFSYWQHCRRPLSQTLSFQYRKLDSVSRPRYTAP